MIILEDGGKEMLPYVQVRIEPGRFWFEYWFEVHYWDAKNTHEGKPFPCWVHDYEKDGGGFGLWFVWRKAQNALSDTWTERFDEDFLTLKKK